MNIIHITPLILFNDVAHKNKRFIIRFILFLYAFTLVLACSSACCGVISTNLYTFTETYPGITNGFAPSALLWGNDGSIYGATRIGGIVGDSAGTVFKLSPRGVMTILYSFTGTYDGGEPVALVQGRDGALYGVTQDDGTNGFGTIFRVTTNGVFNSLYSFSGTSDGESPQNLAMGSDGNLYGTTGSGGAYYSGNIFMITPGVTLQIYIHLLVETMVPTRAE